MASSVKAPAGRDLGNEYTETLNAQIAAMPALIGAMSQYGAPMANAALGAMRPMMGFYENELYPALSRIESQTAADRMGGTIDAANQYGQQLYDTNRRFNPQNTALLDELNRQAMSDLTSGGSLSAGELRDLQQATRAGQVARGLGTGRADYFAEVLNTDALQRQRLNEARQFAGGMVGMNAANNPNALLYASTMRPDIAGRATGLPSLSANNAASGLGLLNPESAYASDLYNTNFNAEYSTAIANANNKNAITAGIISAVGNVLGSAVGGGR